MTGRPRNSNANPTEQARRVVHNVIRRFDASQGDADPGDVPSQVSLKRAVQLLIE